MIYSRLYREYYPFKSASQLRMLDRDDLLMLVKYIKEYPARAVEAIYRGRKYGYVVKHPEGKGFLYSLLPSRELPFVADALHYRCSELACKLECGERLSGRDIADINDALYSHKYNWVLSLFLCPLK